MSDHVWTVPATVLRVVDGATLLLRLDLGCHISYETECTLIGVAIPDPDGEQGQAARRFVIDRLGFGGPLEVAGWSVEVTFISHQLDQRGRPVGQILGTTPQGQSFDLGLELLNADLAVPMAH